MKSDEIIADILGLSPPKFKEEVMPYKGAMIYDHKTGGQIQIMSSEVYSGWKSYQPGRHGRSAVKKAGAVNTCHI